MKLLYKYIRYIRVKQVTTEVSNTIVEYNNQNTSLESTECLKAGKIAGSPSEPPTPKVSLESWYSQSDPSVKQNTKHSSQD